MSIQRTHWDDCWKSGPEHYECAVAEVERLRNAVSAAREIVDEFYGPTKCDCDPSVGINSCHACTIRGTIDEARGES